METLVWIGLIIMFILLIWRFLGFLFKPVETAAEKLRIKFEMRKCPFCKSEIPKDAVVCKYCRREIEPEKEMTTGRRVEIINKVLDKFRSEYPEVKFRYDTTLGDVIIKVPFFTLRQKHKPENVQIKMIEELRNFGIDAKARYLSKNKIQTIGFLEGLKDKVSEALYEQGHGKDRFDGNED